MVGFGVAAGAFLSFGMTPLATTPPAQADLLSDVIDVGMDQLGGLSSVAGGLPDLGLPMDDLAGLGLPGLDVGDPSLAVDQLTAGIDQSLSGFAGTLGTAVVGYGAASVDPTAAVDSIAANLVPDIYFSLHGIGEEWINSPFGQMLDPIINAPTNLLFGRDLIDNGAAGLAGTVADPSGGAGGAGGLIFGDGGAGGLGYDGGAGGTGGAAGLIGDGGAGGDGGADAAGGAGGDAGLFMGVGGHGGDGGTGADGGNGGDGGSATGLFGNGGDGGNAGDGSDSSGLPALGGAGGNGGLLGSHGEVGQYGTLTGVGSGAAPGTDGAVLPLGTTGTWLTNSDGQVVLLHGLNEVYKVAPFEPSADGFSDDDAAFLAANGFNAVRLGVIWSAVEPESGVFNDAYLASIDQTVQTLANHGIYTELDMHQDAYSSAFGGEGAPAWAVQTGGLPNPQLPFPLNDFVDPAANHAWDAFWSNAEAPNGVGLENSYAQMLEHVANYFKGNSDVAGFEIMNEPSPGSQLLPSIFGSSHFDAQELTPFYDQAASAIRAVDPTTPVLFEPNLIFAAGLPTHLGTVDSPDTVFSFHDYCEFQLGPLGCFPSVTGIVGNAGEYAGSQGIPAFMTEFGASSNDTAIAGPMQAADQHLIGWTEWAYTSQGDISTSASPPSSEALVYDPSLPPVGSNVNTANLATLAEPYPQVVSGTPDSWSFDNGTFQFSYSTEMADAQGSFPAGAQTTISVPAIEFPNGYQVSVTGGQVVSASDAPELVIASDGGATTVNVTVSPAAGGGG